MLNKEQVFDRFFLLNKQYMEGVSYLQTNELWEDYLDYKMRREMDEWIADDEPWKYMLEEEEEKE